MISPLLDESAYASCRVPLPESVTTHYGQLYQDLFVLCLTNGKRGGKYLEIGAYHSQELSNTLLLERDFGWKGVSVEIDKDRAEEFNVNRTNPIIAGDALTVDYSLWAPHELDYLQVDCEPAATSLAILKKVLNDGVRPNIITFEHEFYSEGPSVMMESREFLAGFDYELLVDQVALGEGCAFEDWYVRRGVFDEELLAKMRSVTGHDQVSVRYMFPDA